LFWEARPTWVLEDRCLLNGAATVLLPNPTVDHKHEVLYDGVTGAFQKTITITNNSPDQTIYAFLEGELTRQADSPYDGTAAFDPFDPADQEYRRSPRSRSPSRWRSGIRPASIFRPMGRTSSRPTTQALPRALPSITWTRTLRRPSSRRSTRPTRQS
jgi:hypothetical protein